MSGLTKDRVVATTTIAEKFNTLLSSSCPTDWIALGRFLSRVRQKRRRMRRHREHQNQAAQRNSFDVRKAAWRSAHKHVCRHGVFFACSALPACHCTTDPNFTNGIWQKAKFMLGISVSSKSLTAVAFDASTFLRLGALHAELKRRQW